MRFIFSLLSIAMLVSLFSCGGNKEQETKSDIFTVDLTGNDQMQYNLKTIEVPAGSKVRVNLKHIGQMAVEIMGHNFILLKQNVDMAAFAGKAVNAKATSYIPEDEKSNIIAYTKLIGGGESTFIEFEAPALGTYKFLCSFPGHFALMQGDFIVK
jgi:azurin